MVVSSRRERQGSRPTFNFQGKGRLPAGTTVRESGGTASPRLDAAACPRTRKRQRRSTPRIVFLFSPKLREETGRSVPELRGRRPSRTDMARLKKNVSRPKIPAGGKRVLRAVLPRRVGTNIRPGETRRQNGARKRTEKGAKKRTQRARLRRHVRSWGHRIVSIRSSRLQPELRA